LKLSPPLRSAARQRRRRVLSLTGVTRNLNIGCGFNIVPMWYPLRLAEDYAMADILTGGRVIFGVGRGYHTREVETFGARR
jgi:alkanesulfonate monooxygenase SsuD/methylene tetrahydromethanopterin reductase-like flavin-dependent oxidoreductase (luciferase family)